MKNQLAEMSRAIYALHSALYDIDESLSEDFAISLGLTEEVSDELMLVNLSLMVRGIAK